MEKMNVKTTVGLVIYAYSNGLVIRGNYQFIYNKE